MATGDVFILRAQWRQTAGTGTAENNFAFRQESELILDLPGEDLVSRFVAEAETYYRACVSGVYGIVNYAVKAMPANLTVFEYPVGDFSGSLTGDMLPPQVSAVISIKTNKPGRRGRGRFYLPPAVESVSGGIGTPTTAYVSAQMALCDALLGMGAINLNYAVWTLGVWSEADQEFEPAVTLIPRYKFATRRSRA